MNRAGTLQSLLILLAVGLGLGLGQIPGLADPAGALILPFLMLMLVGVFLHVPLRGLAAAFRHVRFTGLSLAINFLWTPVFAWLLGLLFLRDRPDLWVGLLMLLVTPCTDWYLVFTQLARGDVRLAASLLPWHLVLQLLLLPVYLLVFAGALVPIDPAVLVESVLLVLVLPLIAAAVVRTWARRSKGPAWFEAVVLPRAASAQLALLCAAIAAMFASQGAVLLEHPEVVPRLLLPLPVFFALTLLLGLALGRLAGLDHGAGAGLCCATLARNSPVALAIAVAAFPDRPLIALALVIGPLIELPAMAVVAQILRGLQRWWRPSKVDAA
jgi:arsenite transporter